MTRFTIEILGKQDCGEFHCGVEALDQYFHTRVTQDIRRRVTACYVALDRETKAIAGYYTLSAADVPLSDVDPDITRKLPRYPTLPAARIGRLAVDQNYRGQKLGAALLVNAVMRAATNEVAVFAMIVDAKDAEAEAFYQHHGFSAYGSIPGQLIAPLTQLIPKGGKSSV